MRIAPSRRITSALSISISTIAFTSCAYSAGRPRREGNGTCLPSDSCASFGSPISIGDGTLIGINSVVLNGAKIGNGVLVGANTLITEGKEIPDGVLVLGSPGKVVRELKPEERDNLLGIARGYVARAHLYREELRPTPQSRARRVSGAT